MVERSRTAKFHFSPPDSFQLSSLISSRRAYAYFMAPRQGAPRTSPGSPLRARPRSHTAGPAVLGPARCPHVPAAQSCPRRGRGAAGGFEGRFGLQEINQRQRGAQSGTHTHTQTRLPYAACWRLRPRKGNHHKADAFLLWAACLIRDRRHSQCCQTRRLRNCCSVRQLVNLC